MAAQLRVYDGGAIAPTTPTESLVARVAALTDISRLKSLEKDAEDSQRMRSLEFKTRARAVELRDEALRQREKMKWTMATLRQEYIVMDDWYDGVYAKAPSSNPDTIKVLVGHMLDSIPHAKSVANPAVFLETLVMDIVDDKYTDRVVAIACKELRKRSAKFTPSIAEVLKACADVKKQLTGRLNDARTTYEKRLYAIHYVLHFSGRDPSTDWVDERCDEDGAGSSYEWQRREYAGGVLNEYFNDFHLNPYLEDYFDKGTAAFDEYKAKELSDPKQFAESYAHWRGMFMGERIAEIAHKHYPTHNARYLGVIEHLYAEFEANLWFRPFRDSVEDWEAEAFMRGVEGQLQEYDSEYAQIAMKDINREKARAAYLKDRSDVKLADW